jgi:hypothetical protein
MNNELYIELIKADFPFRLKEKPDTFAVEVAYPSLSELIEACGDDFAGVLKREDGSWDTVTDSIPPNDRIDATIYESVARLWLALNNKDNG